MRPPVSFVYDLMRKEKAQSFYEAIQIYALTFGVDVATANRELREMITTEEALDQVLQEARQAKERDTISYLTQEITVLDGKETVIKSQIAEMEGAVAALEAKIAKFREQEKEFNDLQKYMTQEKYNDCMETLELWKAQAMEELEPYQQEKIPELQGQLANIQTELKEKRLRIQQFPVASRLQETLRPPEQLPPILERLTVDEDLISKIARSSLVTRTKGMRVAVYGSGNAKNSSFIHAIEFLEKHLKFKKVELYAGNEDASRLEQSLKNKGVDIIIWFPRIATGKPWKGYSVPVASCNTSTKLQMVLEIGKALQIPFQ